eukprot:GHVU01074515.1.p1 GENE.GHVU01074515.1~~GHVU01074515.1.p1  ORF type:complete len:145 (+),score=32.67 GHVU01074515.1:92-526(+)
MAQKSFLLTPHKCKVALRLKDEVAGQKFYIEIGDEDSHAKTEPEEAPELKWTKVIGLMVDGNEVMVSLKKDDGTLMARAPYDCEAVFEASPAPKDDSLKLVDEEGETVAKLVFSAMHIPGLQVEEFSNTAAPPAPADMGDEFSD